MNQVCRGGYRKPVERQKLTLEHDDPIPAPPRRTENELGGPGVVSEAPPRRDECRMRLSSRELVACSLGL